MKAEELRIKPNEIRLGNYFNVPRKDQSPFRVDVIDFMTKENTKVGMVYEDLKTEFPTGSGNFIHNHPLTWYLKDLSPIPLSEEVLLKCGAAVDGIEYIIKASALPIKIRFHSGIAYCEFGGVYLGDRVKYLHELQNLVSALCGREMEESL